MANKMSTARKTLEGFANKSFDKTFCQMRLPEFASESLQCENEILSHLILLIVTIMKLSGLKIRN